MAKATANVTTTWIPFSEAHTLLTPTFGIIGAERKLVSRIGGRLVRWNGERLEIHRDRWGNLSSRPYSGSGDWETLFWRAADLQVNREKNRAHTAGYLLCRIVVAREDVTPLMRGKSGEPEAAVGFSASRWIAAKLKRMKEAGEIPPGIRITPLSKDLAQRMQKAAKTDPSIRRVITWRTIKNGLPGWGLWPIDSIK